MPSGGSNVCSVERLFGCSGVRLARGGLTRGRECGRGGRLVVCVRSAHGCPLLVDKREGSATLLTRGRTDRLEGRG
jgi:hypothetical protein